ncbi:hypothetical protein CPB85DRAFT_283778 [Mucidula mucida]|nr:hypothetical protein CPB85DRAFT_283778 [Mucidula mucida]
MSDSESESESVRQLRYEADERKLKAAATLYLEFAQVAPYEELISPYVKLWLNANAHVSDSGYCISWPCGDATHPGIVWYKVFDRRIPIDLWTKNNEECWGQIKEALLILEVEIPHLARLRKWMETFVALNSPRPESSTYVFLPGEDIIRHDIQTARRRWKEIIEDKEGRLTRPNLVIALQRRVDDFNWYPMNCGGIVDAMSHLLQEKMFQEFLDLRSLRAIQDMMPVP